MTYEQYAAGEGPIPAKMLAWQVFGQGLESMGRDGKPVEIPVYETGPDQLLVRVDAAGLCFSDIKILNLGGDHPRLYGRDLANDPIVMGHEVSVTVVRVGAKWEGKYTAGDRFVVQAEAYYRGQNLAFGYMLPGGLQEYTVIGPELLEGDDGSYLIPVQAGTGHSEAALSEPWACVVCAYRVAPRRSLKQGGVAWGVGAAGVEDKQLSLGEFQYAGALPAKLYLTDLPAKVRNFIRSQAGGESIQIVETAPLAELDLEATLGEAGADDIFILGTPTADQVEKVATKLARHGLLSVVSDKPLDRPVSIDAGRIHYDYHFYQGTPGPDVSRAYGAPRGPELKPGGKAWMVGGAGPMGQMHVQLAIEMNNGPQVIVASDIDAERLASVTERFGETASSRGKQLICLNPKELGDEAFDARLREIAPDGFDDVVVLVPAPFLISQGSRYVARDGWLNIFAGVARGTMASLDLSDVALRGVRYTGSSGSSIDDMRKTLHMAEGGELSTNRSVAAIGGLEAAYEGLAGVKEARFTGKVMIYPQIKGLPLTSLEELAETLPEVAAKLSPQGAWTREAERALIERYLPAD
jgi:threonine dehydrogenase-like Zn-dependent dehydrogenase